jgi:hypothetical protein
MADITFDDLIPVNGTVKAPPENPYAQFLKSPGEENPYAQFLVPKVAEPVPPAPAKGWVQDVAEQIPQGFNRGFDALYNLPNTAVNFAAKKLGYEAPLGYAHLATRFNAEDDAPKTTAGRYAGAFGEMLGGSIIPTAGMISRGAAAAPTLANALTSSAGSGVASEAAKDAGAGPGWQLAAALLGGYAAPGAVNSALYKGPIDPSTAEKTLAAQAAQDEGISVPKAAMAGSVEKPLAGRLASLPIVGAPLQNAVRTTMDEAKGRLNTIADAYGVGNRATSGAGLSNAIADYIKTGSRNPVSNAYKQLDQMVDDTMIHGLPATGTLANQLLKAPSAAGKNVNEMALATVMNDITGPGLTYSGIKELRTTVGAMLDDSLLPNAGTTKPVLKRIYGALTDDLEKAVENAGTPAAPKAFDKANNLAEVVAQEREDLSSIIGKDGGNAGENVFETVVQLAKDKGKSANIDRLRLARYSVDQQTWDNFSSSFIRRLGIDHKTGEFSPDRFLTAYGELSPEGRQIMFNSTGRPDLTKSLDNLAKVSKQFSEFYKMGNPSGTAGAAWLTGLFGGAYGIGGLPTAIPGAVGMWGMSKYFASPANVDKMTRTLQARLAYQRAPNPTNESRLTNATSALSDSLREQEGEDQPLARALQKRRRGN